jgi:hypothetical protein
MPLTEAEASGGDPHASSDLSFPLALASYEDGQSIALVGAIAAIKDWNTAIHYLSDEVNYTEPLFVGVIMTLATTRPILKAAELMMWKSRQPIRCCCGVRYSTNWDQATDSNTRPLACSRERLCQAEIPVLFLSPSSPSSLCSALPPCRQSQNPASKMSLRRLELWPV